jgi:hypothetical protein
MISKRRATFLEQQIIVEEGVGPGVFEEALDAMK